MKFFKSWKFWGCIIFLFIVAFPVGGFLWSVSSSLKNPPQMCDRSEITYDNILIKLNEYRLSKNLLQLGVDKNLDKLASQRAEELNKTHILTHQSQLIDNFISNRQFSYLKEVGELFVGRVSESKPKIQINTCQAVTEWSNSPTHNDALTDPKYSLIGIGISDFAVVVILGEPASLSEL